MAILSNPKLGVRAYELWFPATDFRAGVWRGRGRIGASSRKRHKWTRKNKIDVGSDIDGLERDMWLKWERRGGRGRRSK